MASEDPKLVNGAANGEKAPEEEEENDSFEELQTPHGSPGNDDTIKNLHLEIHSLRRDKSDLLRRIDELRFDLDRSKSGSQEEASRLMESIAAAESKIADLELERGRKEEEARVSKERNSELEARIDEMKAALDAEVKIRVSGEEQIKKMKEEEARVSKERNSELEVRIDEMKAALDAEVKIRVAREEQIKKMKEDDEEKNIAWQLKVDDVKRWGDMQATEMLLKEKALNEANVKLSNMGQEVKELTAAAENKVPKKDFDSLMRKAKAKISELEATIDELKADKAALEAAVEVRVVRVEEVEKMLEEASAKNFELQTRIEEMKAVNRNIMVSKEMEKLLREEKAKNSELEARINETKAENKAAADDEVKVGVSREEELEKLLREAHVVNSQLEACVHELKADAEAKIRVWKDKEEMEQLLRGERMKNSKLEARVNEMKADAEVKIRALRDKEVLEKLLREERVKNCELEAVITEMQVEADLNTMGSNEKEMEKLLREERAKNSVLEARFEKLEAEVNGRAASAESIQKIVMELKDSALKEVKLEKALKEMQKRNSELEGKIQVLTAENKRNLELEKTVHETKEKNSELERLIGEQRSRELVLETATTRSENVSGVSWATTVGAAASTGAVAVAATAFYLRRQR